MWRQVVQASELLLSSLKCPPATMQSGQLLHFLGTYQCRQHVGTPSRTNCAHHQHPALPICPFRYLSRTTLSASTIRWLFHLCNLTFSLISASKKIYALYLPWHLRVSVARPSPHSVLCAFLHWCWKFCQFQKYYLKFIKSENCGCPVVNAIPALGEVNDWLFSVMDNVLFGPFDNDSFCWCQTIQRRRPVIVSTFYLENWFLDTHTRNLIKHYYLKSSE